jgi:hypothetical protein
VRTWLKNKPAPYSVPIAFLASRSISAQSGETCMAESRLRDENLFSATARSGFRDQAHTARTVRAITSETPDASRRRVK